MNASPAGIDHRWVTFARRTAPLMFSAAFVFLVCQAVLVVLWVDIPNLRESAVAAVESDTWHDVQRPGERSLQRYVAGVMAILWPIVIGESVLHWSTRPWNRQTGWFHFYSLLFCLCPSLRLCARSVEVDHKIWLPRHGWHRVDDRLRRRLSRAFSVPMILIALLILPVLVIEFFLQSQVIRHAWLRMLLHLGTGVIWFAFAIEFILMISVAEKKLAYIKQNWIDLAIISLPLLSFLRSLQLLRGLKIAKTLRVTKLTRMASVYRLRATAIKALRALVLLDVIDRLIRPDREKQLQRMRTRLDQLNLETRMLRREIYRAERQESRRND